ncbi:MAG TPA: hydrogenase expression protein [Bdellovibrionales bacterium]|nr:MAG: hypothetical protein A2Z97_02375 [Bdellovibrionales bacterium GWB1_52_6]OFZ02811.1 MAG: hypothetical protein A2X97_04360 [Bdellovibrionales bacterium GWA1_52_35]OFZ39652.1 MAG: hypothetical protein A2070_12415 [Bdellovibrionales bacterium GWC1_52_8]HAR42532.1 hydrogenase expression protein [Bdellovibrionales bacterium]HCM38393.1 hydrogenase expression protein [Bdellovibrionales bacterium]
MHELGIAQNILKISAQELRQRNITQAVEKVVLRVGRLKAILPDSLTFHFDVLKKELPQFQAAVLDIRQIPVRVLCTGCALRFTVEEMSFFCEHCGAPLSVESGEEFSIDSIEVAD